MWDSGETPDIEALVNETWHENPDFPADMSSNMPEPAFIALGMARWISDGHQDGP